MVALRWDKGNFWSGRSKCPSCNKTLRWYELVPILSLLILKGKCSGCKASVSWQYPLVELFTGLVFATVPLWMLPVFLIYIVIFIYDWYYKVIPDKLVYSAIVLSLLMPIFFTHYSLLDWLSGPIIFIFFGLLWWFSRGRAIGFGDAKLGLSIGLLLGGAKGFSAVILAFWIGAGGFVLYVLLVKLGFIKGVKKLTMKSEVPFAPLLIIGAWASLMFNLDLIHATLF